MENTEIKAKTEKKVYESPELKDFGLISEHTKVTGVGAIDDGGGGPYFS